MKWYMKETKSFVVTGRYWLPHRLRVKKRYKTCFGCVGVKNYLKDKFINSIAMTDIMFWISKIGEAYDEKKQISL